MLERTIDRYTGTLCATLHCTDEELNKITPDLTPEMCTDEYLLFFNLYVKSKNKLSEIPVISGIAEHTISAWASDFIPYAMNVLRKMRREEEDAARQKISGVYQWSDRNPKHKTTYTGSYEKAFLEFLDLVLNFTADDVM